MEQSSIVTYKIGDVQYRVVRNHRSTKTVSDILAEMLSKKIKSNC